MFAAGKTSGGGLSCKFSCERVISGAQAANLETVSRLLHEAKRDIGWRRQNTIYCVKIKRHHKKRKFRHYSQIYFLIFVKSACKGQFHRV